MKTVFAVIVVLHAAIHLLGFVKGFQLVEVPPLKSPISSARGLLWLLAAILFVLFIILYFVDFKYVWLLGFAAVIISQALIVIYWKDARFGTLPNMIVAAVSLIMCGNFYFHTLVHKEIGEWMRQREIRFDKVLSEDDMGKLPEPVRKWLRTSGAVGKPLIYSGKITQKAYLKLNPQQKDWLPASALQYTSGEPPAFIWVVEVKMNNLLFFVGRDKYINGSGHMLIKLNALWPIVNEQGDKLDEGTIQRYLGEIVWFPSLALSDYIAWKQINDTTVMATMTYRGKSGTGTFYFNSSGDFVRFTAQRYKDNKPDARKYEWIIAVEEYKTFDGIKIPSRMTATWKLEAQDWTWLKLEITDMQYNFEMPER
ncbi:MAG: DUF6544 family protein [Bacteroidales bacterium]